ncbi:MAG: hypothetical protein DCC75_07085 [Proteobacteria bacterium]|nr:MAG: hypothetical protein DCC75_07085 [Pseudomonadota bacterium]
MSYALAAALLCGVLSACTPVKPWEKEYLAKPHMSFDPDPVEAHYERKLYQAKEGSFGGYSVGGGGCGCQ